LRQDKPNEFIFANLDNDFPSRIIYRHDSERILHASITGSLKGKFTTIDFPMTRHYGREIHCGMCAAVRRNRGLRHPPGRD